MESKDLVLVDRKELYCLVAAYLELTALEGGGVDNWQWYSESRNQMLDERGFEDFDEMAAADINDYIHEKESE